MSNIGWIKPQTILEERMHPEEVTIQCYFKVISVTGVYFFRRHNFKYNSNRFQHKRAIPCHAGLTRGGGVSQSELVDGRFRVQFPVELVNLVIPRFPWLSLKLE